MKKKKFIILLLSTILAVFLGNFVHSSIAEASKIRYTCISKTEETKDMYKITLKPKYQNLNNVHVTIEDNVIIIFAIYNPTDKAVGFVPFSSKIDANSIQKRKEGNFVVIEIHKKKKK